MKYLEGLLTIHRLMQLSKLMIKSSGLDLTLNELVILATIGRGKEELRWISRSTMIDKATIVRTLASLKEKNMVSKIKIGTITYYMMTSSTISLFDKVQQDNRDALSSFDANDRDKITSCTTDMKEVSNILTRYLIEE